MCTQGLSVETTRPMAQSSQSLRACHAQLTQELDAYNDRTQLHAVITNFMRSLVQRFTTTRLVPRNPYAALLSHVRQAEISASELLMTPRPRDLKTMPSQELLLFDARDNRSPLPLENQIATFKTPAPVPTLAVYAMRSVIERIPYSNDWQRGAEEVYGLVDSWLQESEATDEECVVRNVGAMVGAGVFFLGPHSRKEATMAVEIERHVIVSSNQLELGMTVFARQQIRSLFEVTKKFAIRPLPNGSQLTLVGPCAIVISKAGQAMDDTWTLERATANRQSFITTVQLALVASGTFSMDLLYEHRVGDLANVTSNRVIRCKVDFFFHFDSSPQAISFQAPVSVVRGQVPSNRSFVDFSRVEQSGIFWTTRGANDVCRRIVEQRARESETASKALSTDFSLLTDFVLRVTRLCRTTAEMRHWLSVLPSTHAFDLVQIVSLVDLMIHILHYAEPSNRVDLLHSSLVRYNDTIAQLIQDAFVCRASSLLHGLHSILKEVCSLPEDPEDVGSIDRLYQDLQRSQEALTWLASAAVRDVCDLVQRTTTTTHEVERIPSVDLRADISAAIEQRRFPPAIIAECVFAQYVVETNLDVALERSVVNTVVSGLPPNPFVALCCHLRVFASQFVDHQEREQTQLSTTVPPSVRPVDGGLHTIEIPAGIGPRAMTLVSMNARLLATMDGIRVLAMHRHLDVHQVYRTTAFHPSKATYSARIVAVLVIDDLLLTSTVAPNLMQSIEVVEHIVIEGNEVTQAVQFFADAVRHDVARLLEKYTDAELQLIGPSGEIVTVVELQETQTFQQLLVEATPTRCVLQILFPPAIRSDIIASEPIVRLITKKYVFHHKSTEDSTVTTSISDAFKLRLQTFSVGFVVDAAQTVWRVTRVPNPVWDVSTMTAFATRASQRQDYLLLNHLKHMTDASTNSSSQELLSPVLLRLLDMERVLEWLLHRLLFQQQTALTPRSEATVLVADAKTVLGHVVSTFEHTVVSRVEVLGMVDIRRVQETIAHVRSFCNVAINNESDQDVLMAECWTRQLWTLVLLVRFALQAVAVERYK